MGFWIALRFLAIIPSPFRGEPSPQKVGHSLVYFPVVGLVVGGILFGIDRGLSLILPSVLVNALLIAALMRWQGVVLMGGVWLIIWGVSYFLRSRLGGLTGDTYGAINEVAEVGVLIFVLLLANNQWLGLA